MYKKRTLLFIALLLPLAVSAGDQSDPEIVDPAGDEAASGGGQLDDDADFSDVDVLGAWIDEPDNATLVFFIEKEAASASDTQVSLQFKVNKGPDSVFGSNASGQTHTIVLSGTTIAAGPASAAEQVGTILAVTVSRDDIGASGGDVIADLFVATTRTVPGCQFPPPLCAAQTGTDRAPNSGFGRPYTLERPPVVGRATVAFSTGSVTERNATGNDTVTRTLSTSRASTQDVNATVSWTFSLTNTGTDVDTFNLTVLSAQVLVPNNITATLDKQNLTLDPGATGSFKATAVLAQATYGEHAVLVGVNSTNGAVAFATGLLTVVRPAPPTPTTTTTTTTTTAPPPVTDDGRDPVIGEGTFLQDAAEGMAFDDLFGDWAELVLVALLLLIVILLVFIIFLLAGGTWVTLAVSPAKVVAAPGHTAEFAVEVRNKRRRYRDAMAYFEDARGWKTGVLLRGDDGSAAPLTASGQSKAIGLSGRDEVGDHMAGTLRVQVPADVAADAQDDVTLHVVPIGPDGTPKPRHGSTARVSVLAQGGAPASAPSAGAVPIRLSSVTHSPQDPEAGEAVTTRATLENDSETETLHLRVVLQVDGRDVEAETVDVPPKSARAVLFPWRAGEGTNKVKVQVFEA